MNRLGPGGCPSRFLPDRLNSGGLDAGCQDGAFGWERGGFGRRLCLAFLCLDFRGEAFF